MIRSPILSVFAAQLETFYPDRDCDYEICMKGLSFIRRVLDAILIQDTSSASALVCEASEEACHNMSDTELLSLIEDLDWEQAVRPFFS